ncbi:MAG: MBG domain-containing protein, partial [Verrucomicrobiota bacterium]
TPSNSVLYTGATDTVAIAVEKAPLTITASNLSKVYGAPFPTLTYRCAGFVNGDTEASLTTPVCTGTAARTNSSVGAYWIATGCAASPNYTITFISAALTVTPAPLTITANNQSMSVGGSLPTLTASYYGFVLGNTVSNLTKQPTLTTTATSSSPAGTYPITVSGAVDANYSISYVAGTLTVSSTSQKAAGALAASSTAQIVVNSSVSITAVALLPSGQIQISLSGQAGQAYVLDASSDLMNWTPFATNTLSQASDTYVDQVLPSTMARFYRVDLSNP